MKRLMSTLCASVLALSMGASSVIPVNAAPTFVPPQQAPATTDVVPVQMTLETNIIRQGRRGDPDNREVRRGGREDWRDARRGWREDRRDFRRDRREFRRDNDRYGWYRGHRGYRDYRPGYRRHGDFWFPLAAFAAGAVVTGAIANSRATGGDAHVQWCYDRYRSYRASDNTFQPYNGGRRQCTSPYG
jgi:hypothetical protein